MLLIFGHSSFSPTPERSPYYARLCLDKDATRHHFHGTFLCCCILCCTKCIQVWSYKKPGRLLNDGVVYYAARKSSNFWCCLSANQKKQDWVNYLNEAHQFGLKTRHSRTSRSIQLQRLFIYLSFFLLPARITHYFVSSVSTVCSISLFILSSLSTWPNVLDRSFTLRVTNRTDSIHYKLTLVGTIQLSLLFQTFRW